MKKVTKAIIIAVAIIGVAGTSAVVSHNYTMDTMKVDMVGKTVVRCDTMGEWHNYQVKPEQDKYKYTMDRIEGDYAVIEVYDETTDTISYVNVRINK